MGTHTKLTVAAESADLAEVSRVDIGKQMVFLTDAEVNHLRRLVGWCACEIGQAPDEMVAMVRDLAPKIGSVSDEGKARLVRAHTEASNVPIYVRAAIKSLRKVVEAA